MFNFEEFIHAYGKPKSSGLIKTSPEDFKVDEILGFELTGEGEHLFLQVEKKGLTTEELVKALALKLGKPEKTISYAGLKDRLSVSTQWISVHCPGDNTIDLDSLVGEKWRVLNAKRNLKKLRIGALSGNRFNLVLRELDQKLEIEERLIKIQSNGVPNYFGPQRFGFDGQNLMKAEALLLEGKKIKNRYLRGLYYSAARSFLFNQILSERVRLGNWCKAISGDVLQLAGKNSIFSLEDPDESIQQRLDQFDLSPAAPLWGNGEERASLDALSIQEEAIKPYKSWCLALEQQKLERAWRPLRLQVEELKSVWQNDKTLVLNFTLKSGSYATSVVRELISLASNV